MNDPYRQAQEVIHLVADPVYEWFAPLFGQCGVLQNLIILNLFASF